MPPGNPTALEKTIIAQAVFQASTAALPAAAAELNNHKLLGQQPVPWSEKAVKLAYLDLLEAHLSERTREAVLDSQDLDDFALDEFPFIAKNCDASTEVVNACFAEYYVGCDTIERNREAEFMTELRRLRRLENDESSEEEALSDDDDDEGAEDEDEHSASEAAALYNPVADEDSPSASEDEDD